MAKIIEAYNLNRDNYPEKLITVSIGIEMANKITRALNNDESDVYYKVVDDDYNLNLESKQDVTGETRPIDFIERQYGLKVFYNDYNLDLDKEMLLSKKKTELEYLKQLVEEALLQINKNKE